MADHDHESEQRYRAAVFGAKGIIRILLVVLAIVAIAWLGRTAYTFGYSIFNEKAVAEAPGTDVTVTIPNEASVRNIGNILAENGLISDVNIFVAQERLSAYHGELKGGTYTLNTSMTPTEIMAVLAGDTSSAESTS
ncbi:MAG: endolytic transglycosylase MltG [Lachnospiraceae bacterium]|jgi:UPF0755 protein|nr:endolytic transglycosylase MltG [Lachnospiraceae bacterium]